MLEIGYVKLFRSLLNWEWYDDHNTFKVFIHLLLTVSIEDGKWHGIEIKRGSRVSSYSVLSKEIKLSERQIRTAISHLESTGEVTRYKHPKFTVFSVNNFDKWQSPTGTATECRQGSDKVATEYRQQYKKDKKEKKDNISFFLSENASKNLSTVGATPTLEEVESFCEEIDGSVDVKRFYDYYTKNNWATKNGDPITNWKKTFLDWERREGNFESKPKKLSKNEIPESPMADAYRSLVYNID